MNFPNANVLFVLIVQFYINLKLYHMEIINENPVQENKTVKYAGFWWRFIAIIIDAIAVGIVQQIVIIPLLGVVGLSIFSAQQGANFNEASILLMITSMIPIIGLSVVINWLYFALMESSKLQGTLGKMALSIRVTDLNGERISFGRATGRFFGKIISAFIFYIGFIMAGFTGKKQALHDMMAGCLVIKQ